jgi:hypothetical protein
MAQPTLRFDDGAACERGMGVGANAPVTFFFLGWQPPQASVGSMSGAAMAPSPSC